MPRLFVALEIPHNAVRSLGLLRNGLHGANWVEEADYHITVNFFGDVEAPVADEIVTALDSIKCPPFSLQLSGLDVFTPKKPHSLYAALFPSPELINLHETIARRVRQYGIALDKRAFIPHVTLARIKQAHLDNLVHYLSSRANFSTAPFEIKRFVLMSSRESIGGGPYIIEAQWPLNKYT